jgi:hypothetical protein
MRRGQGGQDLSLLPFIVLEVNIVPTIGPRFPAIIMLIRVAFRSCALCQPCRSFCASG